MDKQVIKYVKKSSYRVRAIKALGEGVKMPTELARDSDILPNHMSNVLRELKEKNLVVCLNPRVRKGRLYRLTDDGLEVLKEIK